jgi:hypothetical protein
MKLNKQRMRFGLNKSISGFAVAVLLAAPPLFAATLSQVHPAAPVANIFTDEENWIALRKDARWSAIRGNIPKEPSEKNQVWLSDLDLMKVEACFSGHDCVPLDFDSNVGNRNDSKGRRDTSILVRRLSSHTLVAYSIHNANSALLVDLPSGRLTSRPYSTTAMTVDVKANLMISVVDAKGYASDVYVTDLAGKNKKLLIHLPFTIADVQAKNGVLYVLAKARGTKRSIFSSLFALLGHPINFEDWSMLEIDLATANVRMDVLAKNLGNAAGLFMHKWVTESSEEIGTQGAEGQIRHSDTS